MPAFINPPHWYDVIRTQTTQLRKLSCAVRQRVQARGEQRSAVDQRLVELHDSERRAACVLATSAQEMA